MADKPKQQNPQESLITEGDRPATETGGQTQAPAAGSSREQFKETLKELIREAVEEAIDERLGRTDRPTPQNKALLDGGAKAIRDTKRLSDQWKRNQDKNTDDEKRETDNKTHSDKNVDDAKKISDRAKEPKRVRPSGAREAGLDDTIDQIIDLLEQLRNR